MVLRSLTLLSRAIKRLKSLLLEHSLSARIHLDVTIVSHLLINVEFSVLKLLWFFEEKYAFRWHLHIRHAMQSVLLGQALLQSLVVFD